MVCEMGGAGCQAAGFRRGGPAVLDQRCSKSRDTSSLDHAVTPLIRTGTRFHLLGLLKTKGLCRVAALKDVGCEQGRGYCGTSGSKAPGVHGVVLCCGLSS